MRFPQNDCSGINKLRENSTDQYAGSIPKRTIGAHSFYKICILTGSGFEKCITSSRRIHVKVWVCGNIVLPKLETWASYTQKVRVTLRAHFDKDRYSMQRSTNIAITALTVKPISFINGRRRDAEYRLQISIVLLYLRYVTVHKVHTTDFVRGE